MIWVLIKSCNETIGKLFNRVIHSRLLKFINNTSLISENQIRFKAKNRTADHLFSLKTIIDQYQIKKKKVFAAFIN
jgi:archaellum component FlaD/FlaE